MYQQLLQTEKQLVLLEVLSLFAAKHMGSMRPETFAHNDDERDGYIETVTILGYNCQLYEILVEGNEH